MNDHRRPLYDVYLSAFKATAPGEVEHPTFHRILPFIDCILDRLGAGARVLELGCGGGLLLQLLSTRHSLSTAIGVDLSSEQVAIARQRGVDARMEDALEFLSQNKTEFDLVLAVDFLEHLNKPELLRLTDQVFDILVPGGCFFVQTPNGEGIFSNTLVYGDLTHETILTPGSARQLLRRSGFEEVVVCEVPPVGGSLRSRARLGLWSVLRACVRTAKWIETGQLQRVWTQNMVAEAWRPASVPRDPS